VKGVLDLGSFLCQSRISQRAPAVCHAKPAREPTEKTTLDERENTSLSSVQSLYVVELKFITHAPGTSDACDMHTPIRREVYCQSGPSALLTTVLKVQYAIPKAGRYIYFASRKRFVKLAPQEALYPCQ